VPTQPLSFDALQKTLLARRDSYMPQYDTLVVLPSLSFPASELAKIIAIERYEERLLYLLLQLAEPDAHIVYLTSLPVDPTVVDYYLRFLPDPDDARRRLTMVSLGRFSGRGLACDLATDAAALARVRQALADHGERAVILPFNVTEAERSVALELDTPLFAVHPDLVALGSKTGSRRVARAAGVPVLPGVEDLWSPAAISEAVDALRLRHPDIDAVVVKLNNGFSGQGNAMVTWSSTLAELADRDTVFCAIEETWESYAAKIAAEGAIVEQLVSSRSASPSAQAWISPAGEVSVVSTHDQILGGPGGQVYLGCRFPAQPSYRPEIIAHTYAVGRHLADAGVVGPFAIDYSVLPTGEDTAGGDASRAQIFLSEINLRLGGTTHPFGTACMVTGASADAATALHTDDGERVYISSDNLKEPGLIGVTPGEVIARVDDARLAFDPASKTGVTLHLLGAVEQYGKLGAVCLARSHDEAERMLSDLTALLRR
jgi:PGM1 C-terminal domain